MAVDLQEIDILTFHDSDGLGITYTLTDPDLTYFLFNTAVFEY